MPGCASSRGSGCRRSCRRPLPVRCNSTPADNKARSGLQAALFPGLTGGGGARILNRTGPARWFQSLSMDTSQNSHMPATLDAQALARLHDLDPTGKHGVVQKVMRTFDTSLERGLQQIRSAVAHGDAATIGSLAHTLKSSSASVGALALSARCAEVERAVRDGRLADMASNVPHLLDEGERAQLAVRAMLRS